jgi:hypothetical protein
VLQQHLERVADAAELPSVAADLVQDRALGFRCRRLAELDIDDAELATLLKECQRIDRLPQLVGRERELERLHGFASCRCKRRAYVSRLPPQIAPPSARRDGFRREPELASAPVCSAAVDLSSIPSRRYRHDRLEARHSRRRLRPRHGLRRPQPGP